MQLVSIGFGGMVSAERIISIISPDSAPVKRIIQDTRERGLLIDASFGRKTRSVIVADSGHVLLSALTPEVIAARIEGLPEPENGGDTDADT